MSQETSILPRSPNPPPSLSVCSYRCVCGESFVVERNDSMRCPKCGRHYSPAAIAGNYAETMTIAAVDGSSESGAIRSPATDDLVGKTLGHFRIVSVLGQGGMGTVYQAVDESLQRYVALKVIRAGAASAGHYERLVHEARAQARVSHPHVVHIYFVGLNESTPFFAMELINGPTLADRLRQGPLPFYEMIRFAIQIAGALERAAEFDIIHGDIKPSNILQVDYQTVKISDFGLSQSVSESSDSRPVAGTPSYLSPEAARGESADIRSDMYSLGITLFELTFGRLPYVFTGRTLQENLDVHVRQTPNFPVPWPPELPVAWHDVLAKLLAKEPAARYSSYAALADDLRRLLPVTLVPAARLPRLLAWVIDLVPLLLLQLCILIPATLLSLGASESEPPGPSILSALIVFVLSSLVFLGGIALQCAWGTTPGKNLFQLRIVDRHGLTPAKPILATRFVFQFLPLTGVYSTLLDSLGLGWLDIVLTSSTMLVFLASGLMVLFSKERSSLHDRILRTRVVVDTQGTA